MQVFALLAEPIVLHAQVELIVPHAEKMVQL
jgi:hypothetical protein